MTNRSLTAASLLTFIAALISPGAAHARLTVLHVFTGSDGAGPGASLIHDTAGNLYGTTDAGGIGCSGYGCGTVFKLAPDGTETVLYAFPGGVYGMAPVAGVIRDKAGNLYGTTNAGGFGGCAPGGCGIVFKLAPDGTETVLHDFAGGSDGAYPSAALIRDKAGDLYGTTVNGGSIYSLGCGTIFKLAPDGTETLPHVFGNGNDGCYPGYLIEDKAENFYGTTGEGGGGGCDCGTVFKLAPDGSETVLYAFKGGSDGDSPAGLMRDNAGNLYGVTSDGGGGTACGHSGAGCGTIFRLAPDGTETVLYAFTGGSDGSTPNAGLIEDGAANLYGTTSAGGAAGYGTVFKLAPNGTEVVLYSFTGKRGAYPSGGLIKDKSGYLYGATALDGGTGCGGVGCGTIFRVRK